MALYNRLINLLDTYRPAEQSEIDKLLAARQGKAGTSTGPAAINLETEAIGAESAAQTRQLSVEERLGALNLQQQEQALGASQDLAGQELAQQKDIEQGRQGFELRSAQEGMRSAEDIASKKIRAGVSEKTAEINHRAEMAMRDLASIRKTTADDIFATFRAEGSELAYRRDANLLEQLGFNLALQDTKYTDELERIGTERNLMSTIAFQEEMNSVIFGDELSKFLDTIQFNKMIDSKDRDFMRQLGEIDIDAALQIGRILAQEASAKGAIEAASKVGGTAVAYSYKKPAETT